MKQTSTFTAPLRELSTRDRSLCVLYVLTNALFVVKYSARVTALSVPLTILFVAVELFLLAFLFGDFPSKWFGKLTPRRYAVAMTLVALALAALVIAIPQGANRVARYDAIHIWIGRLLHGEFPYNTTSYPSGFPILFVISFPFYLLGDIGMMQIAAFIAFAWLLFKRYGSDGGARRLLLLLLSPAFLYEVVVRSELFSNMIVVLLVLWMIEQSMKAKPSTVVLGLLAGLALSTRAIAGIAYAVMFPYFFRSQIAFGVRVALIAAVVFAATLVPFAVWDWNAFVTSGPLFVQSINAPAWLLVVAVSAAVIAGFRVRTIQRALAACAFVMSGIVAAVFIPQIIESGWHDAAIADHAFDIGYFCFAIPFALMALEGKAGRLTSLTQ